MRIFGEKRFQYKQTESDIFLQKRSLEKNTIANANLLISTTKLISKEKDEEQIRFGMKTQQNRPREKEIRLHGREIDQRSKYITSKKIISILCES